MWVWRGGRGTLETYHVGGRGTHMVWLVGIEDNLWKSVLSATWNLRIELSLAGLAASVFTH